MYASNAGKSGGEFFTPQEVSELLTRIAVAGKTEVNKVYDPACGSGSLLLKAAKLLGKDNVRQGFYGQEINLTTYNLCRINMFLHDIDYDKFDIAHEAVSYTHLFFAFTEEDLAQLRLLLPKGYFYSCLEQAGQEDAEQEEAEQAAALRQKAADFLQQLQQWRQLAHQVDLSSLVWQLYKDTGFYEYVGALRDGVQRQANLRALHAVSYTHLDVYKRQIRGKLRN